MAPPHLRGRTFRYGTSTTVHCWSYESAEHAIKLAAEAWQAHLRGQALPTDHQE